MNGLRGAAEVLQRLLREQLGETWGTRLWRDNQEIIRLYEIYDGKGQAWATRGKPDYTPTKRITNHIKHLIKEEARFMLSRAPEISIVPRENGGDANAALCAQLEAHVREVLEASGWSQKLTSAGRDCFIGKRVALKVHAQAGQLPKVQFRPSLEFYHDVEYDDAERLTRVIFAYHQNHAEDPARQRLWVQTYRLEGGRCLVDEFLYNGLGARIETVCEDQDTGLAEIPVYIILNDAMTGDLTGESDVAGLVPLQDAYNRMTSDDQDALRFNMFPQRIFADASQECLEKIQITPGGIVDLQTDPAAIDRQAKYGLLEAGFGYHDRIEGALERVMSDMYQIMGVPKATVEDYKGVAASGKAMRALYWPLITRCEEKWAAWDAALTWLVRMLVAIDGAYGANRFGAAQYSVKIEHLWPITEDEEEERERDLKEVRDQVRSRKSYMEKWQPQADSEEELRQIKAEQALLEDAYAGAIGDELNGRIPESPGWRAPDSAGGDRRGEQGDSRGL